MNHCVVHTHYHSDCLSCQDAVRQSNSRPTPQDDDSGYDVVQAVVADVVSDLFSSSDSSSSDYSSSDSSSSDSSSSDFGGFDGGDSGGGGASGDF